MTRAQAPDDLLTITEAAALLRIQPASVQPAIWRGTLRTVELAGAGPPRRRRSRRRPDVEAYGASRKTWKRTIAGWAPRWERQP